VAQLGHGNFGLGRTYLLTPETGPVLAARDRYGLLSIGWGTPVLVNVASSLKS
jgi:hypothetical protein